MDRVEYDKMFRLEDGYWWYRALRDRIDDALERYSPGFCSLLDAGCGTGGVLHHLRAKHPAARLVGLDVSSDALEHGHARGLGSLTRGSVNEIGFRSGSFDVVTSHDVLYFEGIDDERAVNELVRVLADGGLLILNLPAFDFLRGSHDDFVRTRRRYTRDAIRILLAGAGLKILKLTYWNAALFPAVAVVRRFRRDAHGAGESDLRPLSAPVNDALHLLLRVEAAWLRHGSLPFGTSVFCAAQKPGRS